MGSDGDTTFNAFLAAAVYNSVSNEYMIVWGGEDDSGALVDQEFETYGQRLDGTTGAEIGVNDFRISDMGPDGDASYAAFAPAIAVNSTANEYLVTWAGTNDLPGLDMNELEIWGQRLTSTGLEAGTNDFRISQVGTDGDPFSAAQGARVAYSPIEGEYLVIWRGQSFSAGRLSGQRISADGMEIGDNDFPISDEGTGVFFPGLARSSSNNTYLVAFPEFSVSLEPEIFGRRVQSHSADLSLSITTGSDAVTAGKSLTYSINVMNAGPDSALGVQVVDTLPSGLSFVSAVGTGWNCVSAGQGVTCSRSELAVGAAPVISLVASASNSFSGVLTNTASVSSTMSSDDASGNDSSRAVVSATRLADLVPTLRAKRDGKKVSGRARCTNSGDASAGQATLSIFLSRDDVFDSVTDRRMAVLPITALASGNSSRQRKFSFDSRKTPKKFTVFAVCDSLNSVVESDEDNNILPVTLR
jgi:uncharacterized repeat protein (TIGR01451 family)